MIPSNTFWFNNGLSSPLSEYVFRTLDLGINLPVGLVARDGSRLVYNEGKLHLIGGWNPGVFGATNDSTNQHWVNSTPDDPTTWVQLSDAPFQGVHQFGCVVKDGYIYKYGNDYQNAGKTSYRYNEADGWVLISAAMTGDWGDRYAFSSCLHNGYFYAFGGGSALPGTYLTNVIRSSDCINWETVGSLPAGDYWASIMISHGNDLYIWGGGTYLSTGQSGIYKSANEGFNWSNIGTLPLAMRGTYQNGLYYNGNFWHLNGYNVSNQRGLYYTKDFVSWTQLYDNTKETHASAMIAVNNKMYRLTGNIDNYYYSNEAVATSEIEIPTGASAIYSVFNSPNFSGNYAMEVQRSSDNAVLDIGFLGNDIDEEAMITFMGAGDLFVSKWYDRSGNNNHATNTLGNRPKVGNAGVLYKDNGKVAVYHPSGSVRLLFNSTINLTKEHTIFSVINLTTNDREFIGGGANTYMLYRGTTDTSVNLGASAGTNTGGAFALNTQMLLTDYRKQRVYQRYYNENISLKSFAVSANVDFSITNLSGESNALYNFIGYMQFVAIYAGDKLPVKKGTETCINDYFGIY